MGDMIERVAKAIYEDRNGPGCEQWGNKPKGHKDPYRADAKAAIAAMREPSSWMLNEAVQIGIDQNDNVSGYEYWQRMIDAALA